MTPLGGGVPNGWSFENLEQIANRGSGHTPAKSKAAYWNGGVKWVSLRDTDRLDSRVIADTVLKISDDGLANSSAVLHPRGTVIVLRDASVGKSAILADSMAVSQHFITYQCGERLDNRFLYYWFQLMKSELERIASGSTIATIGLSYFRKLKIPLPELPEQRRISKLLWTFDEVLIRCQARVAAAERRRAGLTEHILTSRLRFRQFCASGWTKARLREVTFESRSTNKGLVHPPEVMGVSKVNGIVPMRERTIPKNLARYKVLRPRAFAYNPMRINIGSIARWDGDHDVLVSPDYVVFETVPDKLDDRFLNHYRRSNQWKRFIEAAGNGSVRVRIYYRDLASLSISLPPLDEQKRIADVLDLVDREIALLRCQLDLLNKQKRALMQKLFTGEVRIKANGDGGGDEILIH